MKKRLLATLLTCALAISMVACGSSEAVAETETTEAVEAETTEVVAETETTEAVETETTEVAEEETTEETTEGESEVVESTGELTFDIPEEFTETSENVYTVEGKYSNINRLTLPNDGSFGSVSSDILAEQIEKEIESEYGEAVEITVVSDEYYEIDGRDALRYEISYELMGTAIQQIQVIIDDENGLEFITFSDLDNEGYIDAFNTAIDSIRYE